MTASSRTTPPCYALAAIVALREDPAATVYHRVVLLALVALAGVGGEIPTLRDAELAHLLRLTKPIAGDARRWLTNRNFLASTRRPDRALSLRIGPAVLRFADPDRLASWLRRDPASRPARPDAGLQTGAGTHNGTPGPSAPPSPPLRLGVSAVATPPTETVH